jgi:TrmH family RNA methyltransferase
VERISSRQNAVVRRFRELAHAGPGEREMLLEGSHLLEEALDCGLGVTVAAFAESALENRLAPLEDRAARAGVRTIAAADALFRALSPAQTPSGVVSIATRPTADLEAALERAPQLLVLLEGVQEPGNVGAVIRAAEALGATGVIVGAGSADPFGWKALRGAMGSSLRLPVVSRASIDESLRVLRLADIRIFVAVPRSGFAPADLDLRKPSAIVLGGEGPGLPQSLLNAADERLTVPMQLPVESLNVAVAAALVLYEAARQRADVAVR